MLCTFSLKIETKKINFKSKKMNERIYIGCSHVEGLNCPWCRHISDHRHHRLPQQIPLCFAKNRVARFPFWFGGALALECAAFAWLILRRIKKKDVRSSGIRKNRLVRVFCKVIIDVHFLKCLAVAFNLLRDASEQRQNRTFRARLKPRAVAAPPHWHSRDKSRCHSRIAGCWTRSGTHARVFSIKSVVVQKVIPAALQRLHRVAPLLKVKTGRHRSAHVWQNRQRRRVGAQGNGTDHGRYVYLPQ